MSPNKERDIDFVDATSLLLGRIAATCDGILALCETGNRDSVTVLASMASDGAREVLDMMQYWWASRREDDEPAKAPDDLVCKPCAKRFDHQGERAGARSNSD